MVRNKKDLIKKLKEIGELKIEQGIEFKSLSLSIEERKDDKTLKEWKEFAKNFITDKELEK